MQTAGEYQELLQNPVNNAIEIAIHESQLTWLVYIIGAAIGGRMTFTANDDHDILDGDLVVRVSCNKIELNQAKNNKIILFS